jgi:hypothetical protein
VGGTNVNDHLELRLGARPWQPTDGTRLVTELDFHDVPTAGVFEQDGHPVLFMCADGHGTSVTVWVYAPLEIPEAEVLSALQGGDTIDAEIKRVFRTKPMVAALAVDGRLRLAAPMRLRTQRSPLREAALAAVTEQAESEQEAVRSLLTPA